MSIQYREAANQDAGGVFALAAKLASSYIVNIVDFHNVFEAVLNDKNVDLIVAEKDMQLVGFVLAFHHPTFYANGIVSWVEEIYVLDEYRGMGIGKHLMDVVEDKAQQRGSKLVALATRRAGDFYKAIGYAESAVYFKKELSTK